MKAAGEREVGYWIGSAYWGNGIATAALAAFLQQVQMRPLYAHVAKHNRGSLRVLEKCGFTIIGEETDSTIQVCRNEFQLMRGYGGAPSSTAAPRRNRFARLPKRRI